MCEGERRTYPILVSVDVGLQGELPAFGDLIDSAGFSKGKVVKSSPLAIS